MFQNLRNMSSKGILKYIWSGTFRMKWNFKLILANHLNHRILIIDFLQPFESLNLSCLVHS